jgi:hypothetical protein
MDDLGLMDSAFVVTVLSRRTFSAACSRANPLESYPGNKRSGAEELGHDEQGESKTPGRLALIADRHIARTRRRLAVKVIGRAIGFHLVSLHVGATSAYVRFVTPSLIIASGHRARGMPWVLLLG